MVVLRSNFGLGDGVRAMWLELGEVVVLFGERKALSGRSVGIWAVLTFHARVADSTVYALFLGEGLGESDIVS